MWGQKPARSSGLRRPAEGSGGNPAGGWQAAQCQPVGSSHSAQYLPPPQDEQRTPLLGNAAGSAQNDGRNCAAAFSAAGVVSTPLAPFGRLPSGSTD